VVDRRGTEGREWRVVSRGEREEEERMDIKDTIFMYINKIRKDALFLSPSLRLFFIW
jgi:hypothetical protein